LAKLGRINAAAARELEKDLQMTGFQGGLNEGVWQLGGFILKLTTAERRHPAVPTEAEMLMKLHKVWPGIASDTDLAFPVAIFHLVGPHGQRRHDLIVMNQAPGCSLTDYLACQLSCNKVHEALQVIDRLGAFLGEFHKRYDNHQHSDFTPSNVFYDESQSKFTLIDVSGIAPIQPGSSEDTDIYRFCISISLCAGAYGQVFSKEAPHRLEKSHNAATGAGREGPGL